MFLHLHTHSCYSFLEGLPSPKDLAQAAAQHGMAALALTDHNGLSGAIEFYDACQDAGVKPILGLELDVAPPPKLSAASARAGILVLLAIDLSGWASLCRLSSALQTDPVLEPGRGLPFERFAQHTQGLICLTGGSRGLAATLILNGQERAASAFMGHLKELFPGRVYIELNKQAPDDGQWVTRLALLARRLGLPVVAAQDVHYLDPAQGDLQRVLAAIRLNRPLDELPAQAVAPPGAYFTSPTEMASRFSDRPAAVVATQEISERCRLELPLGIPHFPQPPLSPGQTALDMLRQKAESGARRLYRTITPELKTRLDHELTVIGECGYAALFLIVEEILQHARQLGVPFSSRGSAASSLVAHCLGITSPDPIRLNLYFERFLNPARSTPPDIDTDLCSRRRDEVIRFVYQRYGAERVAMVCTVNRFRRRSALREVAKAYGLPPAEVKNLSESVPPRWWGPPGRDTKSEAPYAELSERYTSPRHRAIFRDAAALLGLPRHLSIHPGGVVIAPGPLTDLVPTQWATKGVVITQFDLEPIERIGLVKIDLLGIRGLTVLGDVAQAIHEKSEIPEKVESETPEKGENDTLDRHDRKSHPRSSIVHPQSSILDVLEAIPEDDPATADAVQNGRTIGCFQIESPGMRATLKEIQARSVDDIMVALALYRPGPLTGGLKDAFVRRHRKKEPTDYLHTALEPLLRDTFGVILYQEQVLRIAHELAGLNLADADLLRRAMSHFDPGKQMQLLKERFIAGALAKSGVPEAVGEHIWQLMAAFAGYGFPKAHAASYAQVGWRAAWCKLHYPAVFMAAVLANWGGYYSQSVYLNEARRLGLTIYPPHVNHARREFSVSYLDGKPVLFMGLDQVRDLTRRTQARILHERPFHSFMDFLARVDPRPVEAENLVRVGALKGLGSIPSLLHQLSRGGWRGGQLPLFSLEPEEVEDWTLAQKVAAQEVVLGMGVDAHPLELVAGKIADAGALTTVEAAAQVGQRLRVAGTRQTWRRSMTTHGDYIYFMSLEDLEGMLDVVIFSDVYRRCREALSSRGPYVIEGVVELDQGKGEPFIRAEKVWRLE